MKKLFFTMSLVLMLVLGNTKADALELSFGFSTPGLGFNVWRGDDALSIKDGYSGRDANEISFSLMPAFQLDIMLEFLPFLALETGVGYGLSFVSYNTDNIFLDGTDAYIKGGITIPIMARFQYELEMGVLYLSIGPKFIIPFIDDYAIRTLNVSSLTTDATILENNDFGLDVGFALGGEIRLGDANYLGIRVAYDLNVISLAKSPYIISDDDFEFYHDNFGVSLTYRYAFGSKWKNN